MTPPFHTHNSRASHKTTPTHTILIVRLDRHTAPHFEDVSIITKQHAYTKTSFFDPRFFLCAHFRLHIAFTGPTILPTGWMTRHRAAT